MRLRELESSFDEDVSLVVERASRARRVVYRSEYVRKHLLRAAHQVDAPELCECSKWELAAVKTRKQVVVPKAQSVTRPRTRLQTATARRITQTLDSKKHTTSRSF